MVAYDLMETNALRMPKRSRKRITSTRILFLKMINGSMNRFFQMMLEGSGTSPTSSKSSSKMLTYLSFPYPTGVL